jgi:glyoxylase-like metal-dependent hydrolase (beta-lactamase superfamily II)
MTQMLPTSDLTSDPGRSPPKGPRLVVEENATEAGCAIYAFPPNRGTLGGTAYLIVETRSPHAPDQPSLNILIDCPAWTPEHQTFVEQMGGVGVLVITHRGAIAQVKDIQDSMGCQIVIQEQEAYLLPNLTVTTFQEEMALGTFTRVLWTSGHSPGAACVYDERHGGVLFTGRHLLPNAQGKPEPLRLSKTFHWPRQLRSVQALRDRFSAETLSYICPGASTGFLRGKRAIANAYAELRALDLESYRPRQPLL